MRIVCLIENTEGKAGCKSEHGLSYYVETAKHKLLVDTGASEAFLQNAEMLSVDVKQVDTVFLSHGHYDHAGGIMAFSEIKGDAPVYMQKAALKDYYHKDEAVTRYIGIAPEIRELRQIKMVEGNHRIDDELFLFSQVTERELWPSGNLVLKEKKGEDFYQDEFFHEQYLVIEEGEKKVLISGCAHNGILNILNRYRRLYQAEPDAVFSGFHMRKKSGYSEEDIETIKKIAAELKKWKTKFYTGHCTGEEPYKIMKEIMGEQLVYVHSGDEIRI